MHDTQTPPTHPARTLTPLREFITGFSALLDQKPDEPRILAEGGALLATLVARDDWLPDAFAQPHPEYYQQVLLHCDSAERFSIVSFVWGPGQRTPIHDHTVWGLIGMLRGAEYSQPYQIDAEGRPQPHGAATRLEPGHVEAVSPTVGDIHRVHNAYEDRVSISIHVYGANIGAVRRHVYPEAGGRKPFISGYSNSTLPNPWDRSKEPVSS
ncbi:cysteine dioxygenase [Cupriavidus sp. 2KB_3]|uniref:cysteine dioxygenase family protein n=1 Tax=Cupriavidus TaxID=106589 RepID=UPI0011EE1DE5|nr:cysteine dioxygenase [Cupriavidus campinensis]